MKQEGLACTDIVAFLETNRFMQEAPYYPSIKVPRPYATDNTTEIIQMALIRLDSIFQDGYRYNKDEVMVGGLIPIEGRQVSLLDPYDREKVASLMKALDQLNVILGHRNSPVWLSRLPQNVLADAPESSINR